MKLSFGILLLIIVMPLTSFAQLSGPRFNFSFLDLQFNARIAALGGKNISLSSDDVLTFLNNPALIHSDMHGVASAGYAWLPGDVGLSTVGYAHKFSKSTYAFGLQYLDYGTLEGYDETGASTGTFQASDFAIAVGRNHQIGPYTMGVNLKYAGSMIAGFQAGLLLLDLGGTYTSPSGNFMAALTVNNAGIIVSDYTEVSRSRLPLSLKLGATIKPEHMPARFSVTVHNLIRDSFANNEIVNNGINGTVNRIMNHFVLGTEILISKNFNLRAGYNHLINQELSLNEFSGGAGFTFGLMIKVSNFEFSYGRGIYHAAGGINFLTLNVNMNSLYKKRTTKNENE